jgi:gliding motility-associated-like protein
MKLNKVILLFILMFFASVEMQGQCGTAFMSSDDTVVCVPTIVRFKVNRFPAGTTFEWDLGSGYVNSDSTYTKLYSVAGVYNVRVKLKYLDGSTCVLYYNNFIQAKPVPVPQYQLSKNVLCSYNDSVILTDITPKTVKRDWLIDNELFKDGPKTISSKFKSQSGYKTFTMFMKDSFGCEGRRTFDSVIFVPDSLSVNFMANKTSGCTPAIVDFTNLTDTLNYMISQWNWQFPGAAPSTSNLRSPKHIVYNYEDTFDVTLNITTLKGCSYKKIIPNYLMFGDSIQLSVGFNKTSLCGNEHLAVTLNNSRSALPSIDASPSNYVKTIVNPREHNYKFTNFGAYSIQVKDNINGCVSEKTFTNYINVNGPIAGFEIPNPYSCVFPDTFSIIDTSKASSLITYTRQWDLYSDLNLSSSIQTSTLNPGRLICNNIGTYAVRLIVAGNNGCRDTILKKGSLQIKKMEPLFSWTPIPACPVEFMDFTNLTPRGTSKVANRYRWTFYAINGSILKKDTVPNPRISYPDTGHYTVKLMAFNNLGCRDSITFQNRIEVAKPIPKFRISDSVVCYKKNVGLKVVYNDSNYYKTYIHQWHFQHTDSATRKYTINGDSANANLLPGMYTIKYTRFSVRKTCYDTIVVPFKLKVSGVNYNVSINPVKVCNPYTATLQALPSFSYNFNNGSTTPATYNWSHAYDTNKVSIWKPNLNPTSVFIKKSGKFAFKFKYTHSSGCNDSILTSTITSGVVANFVPKGGSYYACVGKSLQLLNRSDTDAISFKWFMKDSGSGAVFLPSNTSKEVKIKFGNAGIFKMGLIVYGNGNCSDTLISSIVSNDIKAVFTSVDTLNYCAPIIARISAQKHKAIYEYRWYLGTGDSVTNNLSTIGYLYKANTGPQGSDVRLVVKAYGCNDTMDKKGFIKVIGPIPKFHLTNNVGCEKLKVNFINESKYYRRFFLEYGDGSVLDSINFNQHTYQIYDRSLPFQKFKPTLSVIDSFGCIVQYEKDTIFVLKSPEPNFRVNRDTGCSNLVVQFTNITVGGVSYEWDFEGDGVMDNIRFAPSHTYPAGEYNPSLIATASNGCTDTIRNKVFIKSYERPNVTFTSNFDSICYNAPITFTGNNLPNNSDIVKWSWDFGDPATFKDTAYTRIATYKFKKLSLSQINLLVTDKNNCTDTFAKFIYTQDTIGPVSKPVNFITVSNNQFIDINWGKSKFKDFTGYRLYNDNAPNFTLTYSTANINDTTYRVNSGIDVNASRYCYTLKTKDKCNNLGSNAPPHCTILLQIRDTAQNDLILDWLHYQGWGVGNIKKYRIYRGESGGPLKLIDSVSNNISTYRDKKLCDKTYCYMIEAVEKNYSWISQSNMVCKKPLYIYPSIPVNSIRTTVLAGNATYTHWDSYKFMKYIDHYKVSRASVGNGRIDNYAEVDSTGFIDDNPLLNTSKLSYSYYIRAVDHCGVESPESQINKTILLGGKSQGYTAKLTWSQYEKWYSGVKQYQILIRDNNTFKVIGSIDTASQSYEFDFPDTQLDDSICFKIQAIKDTSVFVESLSNVLCLISDAKMHVPNAFSPNGDDHNDVFLPRAILVFNQTGNPILDYEMEIFNSWGEKVFQTDDLNIGWDGTYQGNICPQGVYIYRIRALALDGITSFNLEGTITLLR